MRIPSENTSGQAGVESAFILTKSIVNYTHSDIENQFRQAMQAAGIHYSGEIIADDNLHRFHIDGHKRSSSNGAYVLHADGCPAGWFMDYKTGVSQAWRFNGGTGSGFSRQMQVEIEKAKRQREAEIRQKHGATAKKAVYIWNKSTPITQQSHHAYLVKKNIQSHGVRLYGNALVIPLRDENKRIVNLQFIDPNGNKRFLLDGRKKGCFHPIGQPTARILICEGFATGASLHEHIGDCVIIALDAGNLQSVAKAIRKMFPANEIVVAGDNDESGVGQDKARKAALAIGCKASIPPIAGMDWNDYLMGDNHNG